MDLGDSPGGTEKTAEPVDAVPRSFVVPERKRFCRNCGAKVGRGRGGAPGRVSGFCSSCSAPFSFEAKLHPRKVVAGRYEVVGVLALDQVGSTYFARDREVDRLVVLKEVADAARTRDIVTGIEHPNIIEVYDVVDAGYLVTEYVDGPTLARYVPLPRLITYGLEILSALGYLHDRGLLHTGLQPDHIVVVHDHVKLVGLDALRRMDDDESPLWTSRDSVPERGGSVASDLYSVGALLAMLSRDPAIDGFVQRATHANPDLRFASAGEMADALAEVVAEERLPGWRVFVDGMAEALSVAPPRRRRPHRSAWPRIETRLRDAYRELGPPEPGKGGHR